MAQAQKIQDLVVSFVRAFGLHRPDQTPCGQPVSVSEAHALMELSRVKSLRQKELADELRLDKSTVSRLVGKLQRRGWVTQEVDPKDRRNVRIRLSESGITISRQITDARDAKFQQLVAGLEPEDYEAARQGLIALIHSLDKTRNIQDIADSITK